MDEEDWNYPKTLLLRASVIEFERMRWLIIQARAQGITTLEGLATYVARMQRATEKDLVDELNRLLLEKR